MAPEPICPHCDNTGFATSVDDRTDDQGRFIPRSVVPCACRLRKADEQRLGRVGISAQYRHCTLENFTAYNESLVRALAMARRLTETDGFGLQRVGDRGRRGLFLEGQAGVGKTHLAVAVLKQMMQVSPRLIGVFYRSRDLLRLIRDSYSASTKTTEMGILRPVFTADLLVLDDLGAERTTDWVDEIMNSIVDTRYSEQRLTIFTSNYPDIPDDTDPNSLLFRIGFRMRSRLHEMCEFVVLDAADYRERPSNGNVDDLLILWKQRRKTLSSSGRGRSAYTQRQEPLKDGKGDLKWPGGKGGNT